jgi:6-pyruvoyltetrahydropterin/6-carboxytetrahydropterin synthase|tara:strand:- start:621 stop:1028 length:408 start_codon:yes stop_codon:yes gene_type:complete
MKLTVNRKSHFNAAHRLYRPDWSDDKNDKVFGKCANKNFHGHNYELIVSLTGEVDKETGYVYDLGKLSKLIKNEVEDYLDHKNLNLDIEDFKNLNPSAENIAILIYNRLIKYFDDDYKLKITLYETPRNFVEYSG